MSEDEQILSDYFDGRLKPAEKAAFEARLAVDAALARRLRLLRAMKASMTAAARPMPAELKASLKRQARARALRSPALWRFDWRIAFGGAFAAAALVLAVRLAVPNRPAPKRAATRSWDDAAASRALKELWSDDDGGDGDEG